MTLAAAILTALSSIALIHGLLLVADEIGEPTMDGRRLARGTGEIATGLCVIGFLLAVTGGFL